MLDVWRPPVMRVIGAGGAAPHPSGAGARRPRDPMVEAEDALLLMTGIKIGSIGGRTGFSRGRSLLAEVPEDAQTHVRRQRIRLAEGVTATLLNVSALVLFNVAVYPTALMRVYFETYPQEEMPLKDWLVLLRQRSRLPGFYRSVYGGTATTAISMWVTSSALRSIFPPPRPPRSFADHVFCLIWGTAVNLYAYSHPHLALLTLFSAGYLCTFDVALRSRYQILSFIHDPSAVSTPPTSTLFIGSGPSLLAGPGLRVLLLHGLVTAFCKTVSQMLSAILENRFVNDSPQSEMRHCRRAHIITRCQLAPQLFCELLMMPFLSVTNRLFGQYMGLSNTSYTGLTDCAQAVWQRDGVMGFLRSPVAMLADTGLAVGYLAASGAAAAIFEYLLPM